MQKLYLCLMLLLGSLFSYAQPKIAPGNPYQPYDSILKIDVGVTSSRGISAATATINNRQIDLNHYTTTTPNYYICIGEIYIGDLPFDTFLLKITATDTLQHTAEVTIPIIHDPAPKLILESPSTPVLADPWLHLKASATDNDPLKYMRLILSPVIGSTPNNDTITFYKNNIDTVLNVARQNLIAVEAWDSINQVTRILRKDIPYAINENPLLKGYYVAPPGHKILDFKYNKVLFGKDAYYYIADPGHDSIINVPFAKRLLHQSYNIRSIWLTPYGAILATHNSGTGMFNLYEWNQGTITLLEQSARVYNTWIAKTAGDYVIRVRTNRYNSKADSLFLRNLQTKQDIFIDTEVTEADLAANGLVVYEKGTGIYKYLNGVKTQIATGQQSATGFYAPHTDGQKIIYIDANTTPSALYLNDGTTNSKVSDLGLRATETDFNNDDHTWISNGYIAYIKRGPYTADGRATKEFWVRDPQGNNKMITSTIGNLTNDRVTVNLRLLSPEGNIMFRDERQTEDYGTRYGNKNGFVRKVATTTNPGVYFESGGWFLAMDSVLFKINPDTTFNHQVTPFAKNTLINTPTPSNTAAPIKFTANDFVQHYSGPADSLGQLTKIQVTAFPRYGKLLLRGQSLFGIAGHEVQRNDLDSLQYVPGQGIVGTDTLQWKAFNGFEYTAADTAVELHIYPVLRNTAPKLKTLDSQYCAGSSSRSIKITNYPVRYWHTTVTVTLDSITVLPVAADSTFTINPAAYDTGRHRIKVTFSHPLDSISTIAVFKVVTGIEPKVNLTANINPVTGSATSVVITANNQTTGTTSARYTFAKDSLFANIIQAESTLKTLTLPASALVAGINPIYVRMKVSGTCLGDSIATDSIHIIRASGAPLQQPVITSIAKQYCQTASPVKVRILNLPPPQTTNVKVTLDNNINLPVGSDSSFVINPAAYAAGNHSVKVTFANGVDSLSTVVNFSITARAMPDVNLSANINPVISLKDTVVITATNVSGGGKAPLYTFAWNSSFTNVIQWEGVPASITVDPASLAVGNNRIYVRMKTSEACYAHATATDSINIIRSIITAVGDVDPRNDSISVYPNPFNEQFTVNGLKPGRTYILTLYDPQGRPVFSRRTVGQSRVVVPAGTLAGKGIYLLKIYEEKKKELPKTLKLLHL